MKQFTASSEPIKEYLAVLDNATSLEELLVTLRDWEAYVGDALDAVSTWTEEDFSDWVKALAAERQKEYMGDEAAARFAVVLLPLVLWKLAEVAYRMKVPFVLVRDRMLGSSLLCRKGGRYELVEVQRA